ncbi:MAG: hypothetical protein ABI196_00635 [Bradyrhizobium sp.]
MADFGIGEAIAIASVAATAVGAGVSYLGAQQSAAAQSKSAAYGAQVAANNAQIANQNATYARQAGEAKATTQSLQARARLGAAVTGEAAQGIDITTGSAADVQGTDRALGQLDTETVRNNAALTAYGYRSQSTNFTAQSGLKSAQSASALAAGDIAGTGDLVSGAASVGQKFVGFQNSGALPDL